MKNKNKIKIANAPCSWGVLEFELAGEKMGYAQVLDEIAESGYEGTELGDWDFMPTQPAKLQEELSKRNLNMLGAFVPVALHNPAAIEAGMVLALKTAGLLHTAGYPNAFIVLADDNGKVESRTNHAGRVTSNDLLTEKDYELMGHHAERIALAVKDKYAMRTVFHHHCAGYVETPEEIDWFLKYTNPSLIGLCFDTGHYMFGGGKEPLVAIEKYYDRIWHVHFKDFDATIAAQSVKNEWNYFDSVQHGIFCELGKGAVPFEKITSFLEEKNYSGWIVVEQDVLPGMGTPIVCAQNNRNYLQSIGL